MKNGEGKNSKSALFSEMDFYKNQYLRERFQFFVFNDRAVLLDSCNSLGDVRYDLKAKLLFDIFPFFSSFEKQIKKMKFGEELSFQCVSMQYRVLNSTYDILLKRYTQDKYLLVLEDMDGRNDSLVEKQQERNEILIEQENLLSQVGKLKAENKDLNEKYQFLRKVLAQRDSD